MSDSVPTFIESGLSFRPDTCQNVRRGMAEGRVQLQAISRGDYPGRKLPRQVLPGLRSMGYWDADCDQQWGTGWHRNDGLELGFQEAGQVTFSVAGRKYSLQAGDASVTRPWLEHCLGDPCVGAAHAYWLVLDVGVRSAGQAWRWPSWIVLTKTDRQDLAGLLESVHCHVWPADLEFQRCFQRIGRLIDEDRDDHNASLLAILINEALALLLAALRARHAASQAGQGQSKKQQVRTFWDELRESPLQLAESWSAAKLADCCGLGTTQFLHYTRQLTNLPPLRYLQLCRLNMAARWLAERSKPSITQIAHAAGFSSSTYFAKVFQEHFGCPPKIYRVAHGRQDSNIHQ